MTDGDPLRRVPRAINVGGHIVKMDALKKSFVRLGFEDVDTFIASGNVLFSSRSKDTAKLERQIGASSRRTSGYEVRLRPCTG